MVLELIPHREALQLDIFWLIHAGIYVCPIQVQLTCLKIERKLFSFFFFSRIH